MTRLAGIDGDREAVAADRVDEMHESDARADWERRIYRKTTATAGADRRMELPAPTGVLAVGAVGHIRLSWNPVPGAAGYLIERTDGLSQCHGCATEDVVSPHASFVALDVAPQQAYANIQALRKLYPGVYGPAGFFDAVSPTTGSVGHRYLVVDQSMIMAALDNAIRDGAMQHHFAQDPVSWAPKTYLSMETMSIQ
jgi:Putative glucoamylase